jgi:hypothetical protein
MHGRRVLDGQYVHCFGPADFYMKYGLQSQTLSCPRSSNARKIDRDAGKRHRLAMEIVDRASVVDCVLILQSLCEFYAAVTGKGKMPSEEAEAQINDWMQLFPDGFVEAVVGSDIKYSRVAGTGNHYDFRMRI